MTPGLEPLIPKSQSTFDPGPRNPNPPHPHQDHENVEAMEKAGIKTMFGDATFTSPNILSVRMPNGTLADISAKGFLICAGAGPSRGSIRGLREHWTYRDALTMTGDAPESLIIAGAGPVGCELAQAFAQMGTNVTLVGPRVLPREAIDASGATINPQHSTLNPQQFDPQPSTINPQHSTLNPQQFDPRPSTLDHQPSTLNPQPSSVNPKL